jgi:hypothetical protein
MRMTKDGKKRELELTQERSRMERLDKCGGEGEIRTFDAEFGKYRTKVEAQFNVDARGNEDKVQSSYPVHRFPVGRGV